MLPLNINIAIVVLAFEIVFNVFIGLIAQDFLTVFDDADESQQLVESSNPSIGAVVRWLSGKRGPNVRQ